MYCSQCGKKIPGTSKFCSECGCSVSVEDETTSAVNHQSAHDAVVDLQKQLREIDKRKKPPAKKENVIKSALKVATGGVSPLDLVFGDSFEEKKTEDKKQLILDYPLPTSPKALASLARYINSEIVAKKREPDALTDVWKEKLMQLYLFAETEYSDTEEFAEIKKYYKAKKRRERHSVVRELVVWLLFPIVAAIILTIVFQLPFWLFVAITALGWEIFFILYVYDLLDDMVASIKEHSALKTNVPKRVRVVAWHLLIPALSALIVSSIYQCTALIWFTAILFTLDFFFLLFFLLYAYDL